MQFTEARGGLEWSSGAGDLPGDSGEGLQSPHLVWEGDRDLHRHLTCPSSLQPH